MRLSVAGALAAGVAASIGIYADAAYAGDADVWNWTASSEVQYASWSANRGFPFFLAGPAHGSELYVPVTASLTGNNALPNWNFEIDGHGGYVNASQTTGTMSGSFSTATDTTLSGTATYTGFTGWQPYVTLMANLPTGSAVLSNLGTLARMDPDIVPVAMFGEGFNFGPTIGINFPFNSDFMIVTSFGYTWRGSYWKEGGLNPLTLQTTAPIAITPSDVWTGAITASYRSGPLTLQGTASYAWETANFVNNAISYRLGARTTISGSAAYAWDQFWQTNVDGYVVHINKNDVPVVFGSNILSEEALDSNNNIYRVNVRQSYTTPFSSGTLSVAPLGSFMYRANNSWDANSFIFVPGKTRWSAGGSANYAADARLSLRASIERVWIHENPIVGLGIPTVDGHGWLAIGGLTYAGP